MCCDGSYYVGITRTSLESRVAQHNAGAFRGYTASRRPVELIFSQWFDQITDAIENERKLKKWSRAKKRRHSSAVTSRRCQSWQNAGRIILRDARLRRAPQDEVGNKFVALKTPAAT
jgi:predicted GIY-YIG superfamily endonuclease